LRKDKLTAISQDTKMAGECDSLSPPEADYLQVLSDLIEAYETEHHPIGVLPAHVMLAAAMEAKGVNQTEVARATGIPVSTISALLSQKRDFNVSHILKLCAYFGLHPNAFIHVDDHALSR
jgi:HTH-type transcriptional regulator/antitoxin HigA